MTSLLTGKAHRGAAAAYVDEGSEWYEEGVELSHPSSGSREKVEAGAPLEEDPVKKPNVFARAFNVVVPYGGVLSGMFNLASVTLGGGIISIPASFNSTGVLMATIYLLLVTVLTVYSIRLLAVTSERTGLKSFEAIAVGLFGRGGDIAVALLMWFLCFGGCVGYVIATDEIFLVLLTHHTTPDFLRHTTGRHLLVGMVWLFCMYPLVLMKRINSLRYVSAVGVMFIVLFVFCIVGHSAANGLKNGIPEGMTLISKGNAAVSGVGVFLFAYLNQINTFSIFYEMRPRRSINRLTLEAALSCGICCLLYFLCGFFGLMDFGTELTDSILLHYDPYKDVIFFVCYVGLIVKLCAAYALNMYACNVSLFHLLKMDVPTMPYWKHSLIVSVFAVAALLLGLFLDDVTIVFGLVGSFCGGFIGFIFPALFVMYAGNWNRETVGWVSYICTYVLLIGGVVGVVFGTGDSIKSLVEQYS